MSEEIYIREADSENARGPYSMDKIRTLAEAGQMTPDTLYYDQTQQAWLPISSNDTLKAQVFPERAKLSLKPKVSSEDKRFETKEETGKAVDVRDTIAAAAGMTTETKAFRSNLNSLERAAALAVPLIGATILLTAVNLIVPYLEVLQTNVMGETGKPIAILRIPGLILGGVNVITGVLIFLGLTTLFPFVRFLSMAAAGFFFFLHYTQYNATDVKTVLYLALAGVIGQFGLFGATLCSQLSRMIFMGLLGLGGMGVYAYLSIF